MAEPEYPGWTIESTHSIDPEAEDYCATCAGAVEPLIATAIAWESPASGMQITDSEGVTHSVAVRVVVP
jgi:hypothetical protein